MNIKKVLMKSFFTCKSLLENSDGGKEERFCIKETGELRSLSFIDWHDGQEYTEQLISASGEDPNFLFDQDGEVFMTDAPTFSKWNAFFRSHYDIESVCAALGLQPISKAEYDPFVHL